MAPPMDLPATRIVDPINTSVARGYKNGMHVHQYLFPEVTSGARVGKIVAFRAEHFQQYDLVRAMGEDRAEIEFGYSGEDYALDQRALDGRLPVERMEEAANVPGIDLGAATVRSVMAVVSLQVELAAAALATNPANYTMGATPHTQALANNDRWDNVASKPRVMVNKFRKRISAGIGMKPDLIIAGSDVTDALMVHPDVIDQVKHTEGLKSDGAPQIDDAKLASYFGVRRYVTAHAMKGNPGAFEYVWGRNVVIAYTPQASQADMGSPSFGYTYRLRNYPIVSPAWYTRKKDSWIYPMTTYSTPVIAGKDAGALLTTVIDP